MDVGRGTSTDRIPRGETDIAPPRDRIAQDHRPLSARPRQRIRARYMRVAYRRSSEQAFPNDAHRRRGPRSLPSTGKPTHRGIEEFGTPGAARGNVQVRSPHPRGRQRRPDRRLLQGRRRRYAPLRTEGHVDRPARHVQSVSVAGSIYRCCIGGAWWGCALGGRRHGTPVPERDDFFAWIFYDPDRKRWTGAKALPREPRRRRSARAALGPA